MIYIGQAFDRSARPLRTRIRWEIIKDGNAGALSSFNTSCERQGIDISSLNLKVAHIVEVIDNEKQIDQIFMNEIENALINRMQPLLNKKGKKNYFGENLKIFNSGDYDPLPHKITRVNFKLAQSFHVCKSRAPMRNA